MHLSTPDVTVDRRRDRVIALDATLGPSSALLLSCGEPVLLFAATELLLRAVQGVVPMRTSTCLVVLSFRDGTYRTDVAADKMYRQYRGHAQPTAEFLGPNLDRSESTAGPAPKE
jgi:hypothetical protein